MYSVRAILLLLFSPLLLFSQSKKSPAPKPAPADAQQVSVTEADLAYLRSRGLLIPVAGVAASQLRNTYEDARSQGRQHNAIDILAAHGTPVLAVDDGPVIKLFQSDKGGITLYHLDPSGK